MATLVVMPQMGYDMREGTVVRWIKDEGDSIIRGEVIAEIETDKATVEMPANAGGVLGKIVVEIGNTVPVGELIAVITEPGEQVPPLEALSGKADTAPTASAAPSPAAAPTSPSAPSQGAVAAQPAGEVRASPIARRLAAEKGIDLAAVTGTGPGGRITEADITSYSQLAVAQPPASPSPAIAPSVPTTEVRASPIARRIAAERGIDLTQVTGTGPGGRITEADVVSHTAQPSPPAPTAAALPPQPAAASEPERLPLSRMRQAIARITTQSKHESPHFYVTSQVDMTAAMALRLQINENLDEGNHASVNDLIVKACAKTLVQYPKFNSSFRDDHLELHSNINVGIAIALEDGLIIVSIPGCQDKPLAEIARVSRDLIQRAEGGTLRAEEYESTFSISNMGMFDVDSFSAIIYPPNAAVLAVGTVKEQPVVRDGQVTVAQIMNATVSVDHRVADGAEAARFLVELKRLLENPVSLLV